MNPITSFEPAFITLKDLAKRFNQSEEYFLMQGAIESLNLLVLVPETAVVGVTNFSGHLGKVKDIRHPDYLKLGLPQISDIRKAESALLTRFPMGYQLLKDGSLSSITAHEGWEFFEKDPAGKEALNGISFFKKSGVVMNEWTITDSLTNKAIQFHRSDILIQRSDFQKLERELTRFVNIDLHHWHSTKVEQLYSASNLFWGEKSVDYSIRESHPNPKKIYEWFIAQGFSPTLATAAITIITPDDAKTRGPRPITGPRQKITKMSNSKTGKTGP